MMQKNQGCKCKYDAAAVYRYQQMAELLHRKLQQEDKEDMAEEEAQSLDLWLLTDSVTAQIMDPQLAAPAVQFLVLEVRCNL